MSLHIDAKLGEIANTVFITGDPLRAKNLAENWLENIHCCNHIRGMHGYTGTYQGSRITIQGTGMGIPSTALYMHELIHAYKVSTIVRVGTCGAIDAKLALGDIIVANEAITDSFAVLKYNRKPSDNPRPNLIMLRQAKETAKKMNVLLHEGIIFSTDLFYSEDSQRYSKALEQKVLAVDMETSMVYAMADYFNVSSLSLLTVSDHIIHGQALAWQEREVNTNKVMKLALTSIFK